MNRINLRTEEEALSRTFGGYDGPEKLRDYLIEQSKEQFRKGLKTTLSVATFFIVSSLYLFAYFKLLGTGELACFLSVISYSFILFLYAIYKPAFATLYIAYFKIKKEELLGSPIDKTETAGHNTFENTQPTEKLNIPDSIRRQLRMERTNRQNDETINKVFCHYIRKTQTKTRLARKIIPNLDTLSFDSDKNAISCYARHLHYGVFTTKTFYIDLTKELDTFRLDIDIRECVNEMRLHLVTDTENLDRPLFTEISAWKQEIFVHIARSMLKLTEQMNAYLLANKARFEALTYLAVKDSLHLADSPYDDSLIEFAKAYKTTRLHEKLRHALPEKSTSKGGVKKKKI
ncbi:MAG: hypothetical protein VB138_01835 [Burkholderia sp.]